MNLSKKAAVILVILLPGLPLKAPAPIDLGNLQQGAEQLQTFQRLMETAFKSVLVPRGPEHPCSSTTTEWREYSQRLGENGALPRVCH